MIDGRSWKWVTREGEELFVWQIGTRHLENIITFLKRKVEESEEGLEAYHRFPPQGELAMLISEREAQIAEDAIDYLEWELIPWLEVQLAKRQKIEANP